VRVRGGNQTQAYGWIDDACVLAVSQTYTDSIKALRQALAWADIWATRHASIFALYKFELIHFTNPREPPLHRPNNIPGPSTTRLSNNISRASTSGLSTARSTGGRPGLLLDPDPDPDIWEIPDEPEGDDLMELQHHENTIKPVESLRYLGIWLDKTLSFEAHRRKTVAPGRSRKPGAAALPPGSAKAQGWSPDPGRDRQMANTQGVRACAL
jgi:hypothetical protein